MIVSSFSNELDEIDEPFLLVLDDYHVIHNPAIHDLLTELLNHPPRALHLVLAVRHDPPLSINSLRARAAVSEIRSHDLRFSLEEALAFLRHTLDPEIDESQAALHQREDRGLDCRTASGRVVRVAQEQRSQTGHAGLPATFI